MMKYNRSILVTIVVQKLMEVYGKRTKVLLGLSEACTHLHCQHRAYDSVTTSLLDNYKCFYSIECF